MTVLGTVPDGWADVFPDSLVPRIIDLVVSAWERFCDPEAEELETRITRRFRAALRRERDTREIPIRIERESVEDDLEGNEVGRIDLRLSHGYREDVYFAIECKRLNVPGPRGSRRSLADEYAIEGMKRFVSGQYALDGESGGMLGYVMDGDLLFAKNAIAKVLSKRALVLKMANPVLEKSSIRPKNAGLAETRHNLSTRVMTLHHFLVSCKRVRK